ncbi:MAG: hypothetical protein COB17_03660 [Sulfurimonas sp.]|nr:MAG: hypothetical protein COB17_03660 [Sulfurimonas sp.]
MKLKNLITLSLLFAFTFSIAHEYVFAIFDEEQCSVVEYVDEIRGPGNHHDDICDIHFEYHHAYMFPQENLLIQVSNISSKPILYKDSYKFSINLDIVIPPIA